MPGDPGGVWYGDQGPLPPLKLIGEATDGASGGRVLRGTLLTGERCDSGGTTFAQHIQHGSEISGLPLEIPGGGRGWTLFQGQQ